MRSPSSESRPEHSRPLDLDLVRRARGGEGAAVDELIARLRCVPRMLAAKNTQLGKPLTENELPDLVQETLIAIWEKLELYEGRAAFESWVYRFCFLQLMHFLRRQRRLPDPRGDLRQELAGSAAEDSPADPLELEEVYRRLDELRPEEADVIRGKNLTGQTFEELAQRDGVPVNTVKTRYYRALLKLRQRLGSPPQYQADEVGR